MRALAAGLLLLLGAEVPASSPPDWDVAVADWHEVVDIERSAQAGGVAGYEARSGAWRLAPDGRIAIVSADAEDGRPRTARLGRYRRQGPWLTVELDRAAVDLATLDAEQRAEYERWQAANLAARKAAEAAIAAAPAEAAPAAREEAEAEAGLDAEAAAQAEAERAALRRPRYLRVPYRGGELLLREQFLPMIANQWDGKGPLELYAEAWRLPAAVVAADGESTFPLEHPLQAGLPHELARLLHADAIQARVVEVLENADSLKWERQQAEVRLQLDRGERAGLYAGMSLRGLPPDEEFYGEIVSASADQARLVLQVDRFAPGDAVALPSAGMRFTTRSERGACPIDASVALRAKVEKVGTPPGQVAWDAEGYAWFELSIDQGAAHGLAVGDRLRAEDHAVDGEGRVLRVASRQATVQWRAQRYAESMEVRLPAAGDALVTPAWQRAAWDVFGGATQH